MNYAEYLKSPRWWKIRARILKRDKGRCRSCGRRATQVHHAKYDRDTMLGGADNNLYSLCAGCHLAVTFDAMGQKRPMSEVEALTLALPKLVKPEKPRKPRQVKVRTMEQIRALSQAYAEGRMK